MLHVPEKKTEITEEYYKSGGHQNPTCQKVLHFAYIIFVPYTVYFVIGNMCIFSHGPLSVVAAQRTFFTCGLLGHYGRLETK